MCAKFYYLAFFHEFFFMIPFSSALKSVEFQGQAKNLLPYRPDSFSNPFDSGVFNHLCFTLDILRIK